MLLGVVAGSGPSTAMAQGNSPVTIDDSPWAWELIQRAGDQAATNPAEAARLLESVLTEHPQRLVPWPAEPGGADATERYRSARAAANELLLGNTALLERWRTLAGPAARRRLEAGDLVGAHRHGLLTAAGQEATLRLAQREVESGRFAGAQRLLEELRDHPDRRAVAGGSMAGDRRADSLRVHAVILEGLAGAGQGDVDAAESAIAALGRVDGPVASAGAESIRRLLADHTPLARSRTITPLDPAPPLPADDAAGASWHVLSSVLLPETLASRAANAPEELVRLGAGSATQLLERGALLASAPSAIGDSVLVNEGAVVRAFDGLGGRARWTRELTNTPLRTDGAQPLDLTVVVGEGDSLVTLVGHGTASMRIGGDRVACLDADTGELRWLTSLSALGGGDGGYEGFFPVGVPVIVDGTVCLFARKVTGRLETVTYVVGLSLEDGSIKWARHHSSAAGIRLGGQRPLTTLFERDGLLYAAASTGAVAAIEASTGDIRWLRRQPVPIREPRYEAEPWELGGALAARDAVFVVDPDQMAVSVLDRDDGSAIGRRSLGLSEAWGLPRYLLEVPADEDLMLPARIVSVGSDIVVFDATDLATPIWRLSRALEPAIHGGDDRLGVRGRVQVSGRNLIIPTRSQVLVADVDTGTLRTLLEGTPSGVTLLAGDQVVSAAADRLLVSMPLDSAERILRQRLAERRDDPDRALSLLALGVRARAMALCVEAGRAALDAISTSEELRPGGADREELVTLLLRAHAQDFAGAAEEAEALHGLLAEAARTPRQRTLQLLAQADHLARVGRRGEAVDLWQTILSDPRLAEILVAEELSPVEGPELPGGGDVEPENLRTAASVATRQMAARRAADPLMAAAIEERAAAALASVDAHGDPLRAAVVAMRFPGTAAGREALVKVASTLVDGAAASDAAGRATRLVSRALQREVMGAAPDASAALPVLDLLLRVASAERAPGRAAAALEMMTQRLGAGALDNLPELAGAGDITSSLGSSGAARSAAALRSALAAAGAAEPPDAPRLGRLSGEAVEQPGRLLRPLASSGVPPRLPADSVLVHRDGAVRRLDLAPAAAAGAAPDAAAGASVGTLAERWALPLDDPDPRVLRFEPDGVLLWSATAGEPVAILVDAKQGTMRWVTPRLSELLPAAAPLVPADAVLPGGAPFDVSEVIPLLSGNRLVLVRRSGEVASILVDAGPEAVWTRRGVLARVHSAWSDDATVLLGGVDATGRQAVVGLDAWSGAELARWTPPLAERGNGMIRWVLGTPDGVGIVGTDAGIEAVDLESGILDDQNPDAGAAPQVLWRSTRPSARGTSRAWVAGRWLLAADAFEGLSAFDLDDGSGARGRFDAAGADDEATRLRDVLVDADGVTALFQQRVADFGPDGTLVGRDAAADFRDYRFIVPAEGRLVVVSAASSEQVETAVGRRTNYTYLIYTFDRTQGCKLVDAALRIDMLGQKIERIVAVDGWLLLSTASTITAVPLAGP